MIDLPVWLVGSVALLLVLLVGATGIALGLWWGELGRRKDAQRREGVLQVDDVEPAQVIHEHTGPAGNSAELAEPPSSWIAETVAEVGCTEDEAREEWRRLTGKVMGDSAGGGGSLFG